MSLQYFPGVERFESVGVTMTASKVTYALIALFAVGVVLMGMPAMASAQTTSEECSFGEQITNTCGDSNKGVIAQYQALVSNVFSLSKAATQAQINDITRDDTQKTASEIVSNVTSTYNANSAERVEYGNSLVNQSQYKNETIAYEITVKGAEDTTETFFVTYTFNGSGDLNSTQAVTSTNATVKESFTVKGDLAQNLNSELEKFDNKFTSTGKAPTRGYFSSLAGKYCSDISGTHPALEKLNDNPVAGVMCG